MKKRMKAVKHTEEPDFHEIDKNRLDDEWINQPKMTRYYGEQLAEAKKNLALAKSAKEVTEAELSLRIRRNPGKFGIDKLTEGALREVLLVKMTEHQASSDFLDAQHEVNMLTVAVTTLQDRRKGLEDLVYLFGIGYFADPRTPKGVDHDTIESMKDKRAYSKGVRKDTKS